MGCDCINKYRSDFKFLKYDLTLDTANAKHTQNISVMIKFSKEKLTL
jgi:hypothetical protein